MNRFLRLAVLGVFAVTAVSCGAEEHFISDKKFRDEVREQFERRRESMSGGYEDVFAIADRSDLTAAQREALQFIYAYSTIGDLGNYGGEFFLEEINLAFMIREHFEWCKNVPEDVFRDFVLPTRASSEYLDTSRVVFFNELKDRVAGMSMHDAALEVNHWCHEKVTYRGTDRRTSANLATMLTSYGRCGEEASFATAAMRAVGIPSRVVMTPRWAHTDDNHAWIEVWVDGQWYYMGACEPEPELNIAWFDGPVKRIMMVNTTVQGPYQGESEVVFQAPLYSRLNLIENYAETRRVEVTVLDTDGNPVEGAKVGFRVYNSADIFSIYSDYTAADGRAGLTTGRGDFVVWASKDGKYGYVKCTPAEDKLSVVLDRTPGVEYAEDYMIEPPVEQPAAELDPAKVELNRKRLAQEDSIRNAYMATFANEADSREFARGLGLDEDKVWKALDKSTGNHEQIKLFISQNKDNRLLFTFLESLSDKDLRDTPAEYLNDHLNAGIEKPEGMSDGLFVWQVLSPRIESELITPWRSYFAQEGVFGDAELRTAADIVAYVRDNIEVVNEQYYVCPLVPSGTHKLGVADAASRNIYFVALCRLHGIPAQIEKTGGKVQYFEDGEWRDVKFTAEGVAAAAPQGTLTLTNDASNVIKPVYGRHFSIAKYAAGEFNTLNLGGQTREFPATVSLDEGYYRVLVASRANDGAANMHIEYLNIEKDGARSLNIKLPELEGKLLVKAVIDMNDFVWFDDMGKTSYKTVADNKGLVLCFMDPDKEPTKHVLQELPKYKEQLEEWGGGVLFMVPSDIQNSSFDPSQFAGLPKQARWAVDENRQKLREVAGALKVDFKNNFPFIVYVTKVGGVLYDSQGYRIGIGEDLVRVIGEEKASYGK